MIEILVCKLAFYSREGFGLNLQRKCKRSLVATHHPLHFPIGADHGYLLFMYQILLYRYTSFIDEL